SSDLSGSPTRRASSATSTNGSGTASGPSTSSTGNGVEPSTGNCAAEVSRKQEPGGWRPMAGAGGETPGCSSTWPFPSATSTSWGSPGSPRDLNSSNRPVRTRMPGGVAGVPRDYLGPLCRFRAGVIRARDAAIPVSPWLGGAQRPMLVGALRRCGGWANADGANAPGRGVEHLEHDAVVQGGGVAGRRPAPGAGQNQAGHGGPRALVRQVEIELAIQLADCRHAFDDDGAVGFRREDPSELAFVLGEDFADELLDEIFHRDEAGHAAVLVHDDRERNPARAHLLQQLDGFLRLRNEERRPDHVLEHDEAPFPGEREQVFDGDVADDVVDA